MSTDHNTDLFLSLTPEHILRAVEAAGLHTNPVCYPLNSFENRVYEVELEDRTRVVAKFYRPGRWSREQILEEHLFTAQLQADEIPVCPVRPFPAGQTLPPLDNIHYCIFERRGGRAPDELTEDLAERLGMLVGRMHAVGDRQDAPNRLRITPDNYIRDHLAWFSLNQTIPPYFKDRYFSAANEIADIADERLEGVPTQRLHGDLHMGNLLLRDNVFNVLDFDDMVVGPAVQDIWLALPGRDQWADRLRAAFLDGYERFKPFPYKTINLIEPLRGMRMVHYAAWLARRWHDPIFPRTWPHFGTEDYWRQETEDLEDLLKHIQATSDNPRKPAQPEPELTNKDFFWDWEE